MVRQPRPGKCRTQNRVIAQAKGELIVCLDDDLVAAPDYVAAVENFFDTHQEFTAMKGRILPAERLGKQKTSWQVVTVIFFLALLSLSELRYANEGSTWWFRAWNEAGAVLVWVTVGLTIYSGLGYAWRHRELIVPNE